MVKIRKAFLFILGRENPDEMNKEILEKIILDHFGNREIIITDKLYEEMKNTMLQEDDYSSIIMLGSQKILDWK